MAAPYRPPDRGRGFQLTPNYPPHCEHPQGPCTSNYPPHCEQKDLPCKPNYPPHCEQNRMSYDRSSNCDVERMSTNRLFDWRGFNPTPNYPPHNKQAKERDVERGLVDIVSETTVPQDPDCSVHQNGARTCMWIMAVQEMALNERLE